MKRALVVHSGGLDSTVALYWARTLFEEIQTISFTYGAKHQTKELEAAKHVCGLLGIRQNPMDLQFMSAFKSHLIVGGGALPEGQYSTDSIAQTTVPFRNGILTAIAVGFAESKDFDVVVLGIHKNYPNYPDCGVGFYDAMKNAARFGTKSRIDVQAPFVTWSKAEIVKAGVALNVPFELTWSCYAGAEQPCLKCGTCVDRLAAFAANHLVDPLLQ